MDEMTEIYRQMEQCRKKLLSYSWTNEALRNEAWAAEEELYALEEYLLKEGADVATPL